MRYIFLYNIDGEGNDFDSYILKFLYEKGFSFKIENYVVDVENCKGKSIWVSEKDFMLALFLLDEEIQPGKVQQIYNERINNIRFSSNFIKN